jgi:hypothetical protein
MRTDLQTVSSPSALDLMGGCRCSSVAPALGALTDPQPWEIAGIDRRASRRAAKSPERARVEKGEVVAG